jgi:hypothetical protein
MADKAKENKVSKVTEPTILDEKDFFEQEVLIRKQILGNTKLEGSQKKASLTILDGISKSVKVHGVKQHGITKKMLRTAIDVFGKMSDDKRHSEKELQFLRTITVLIMESLNAM